MTPIEVDRLELWQAAVMLGRDQKPSVVGMAEQLKAYEARAAAERAQRKAGGQVASEPRGPRVVRSA